MNPTIKRSVVVLAAALLLGGCEDVLDVQNPNSGETERVLATPRDAENLLGSYWKRWHSGLNGAIGDLGGMAANLSLMSYSSLANNCMNNHTPFTGATNFNHAGNTCAGEQYRAFAFNSEVNKVAAIFLKKLEVEAFNLGTPARNMRARAFANFLVGISVGYNALAYDSVAVASATTEQLEVTPFIHYTEARDSMVVYMQRAIDLASDAAASGPEGFPLPGDWIPSGTAMNAANFVRLVHSYRARMLAYMARTPAERAAADWAMIEADAAAGITSNFDVITSTTNGPTHAGWRNQFGVRGLWHQMPPWYIGMADNSGAYAAWIAAPLGDRGAGNQGLLVVTPDRRFPQGATRGAQQTDFAISGCDGATEVPCKRYFVNRPAGDDQYAGSGFGWSNYDHIRHYKWRQSGTLGSGSTARNGPTTDIPLSEMNLLRAEARYRAGDYPAAAALVDLSRTLYDENPSDAVAATANLPAAPTDAVTPVSGGADCVPKVPVGPGYNTIACGTLWDAIVYEKLIETMYMSYLSTFFDARGWGLLPAGTPTYWATPFQEIQARGLPSSAIYGTGDGPGLAPGSFAGPSVYGWEVPR
jgi:hypothetical protein